MSSELKVTFSDKMNKYQYDGHANHIPLPSMAKGKGKLWLGDRDSCSMVQLKHRNIKSVVNAQGDMHGLSKEGKCREGGMVMHSSPTCLLLHIFLSCSHSLKRHSKLTPCSPLLQSPSSTAR